MDCKLHVGVLAFPFSTHAAPLLNLVRRLAASAPGTQFSFFSTADSNSTLFSERVSGNIRAYDVWDGTPEGQVFSGSHWEAIRLFLDATPHNFEKAIEEAEGEIGFKISCLLTDAFLWFASDLAEKRGVPWVSFWTSASCSLSMHMYTDAIRDAAQSKGQTDAIETQQQTLLFIPGMSGLHISDVPPEVFFDKNPTPLALTIYTMVQKLQRSTAVVLNCFEEIDPVITSDLKSKFQHFLNIGPSVLVSPFPPSPDDNSGCLSWLEKQTIPKSVVYISFGTVITPPVNEIVALAEALETCEFPFIWSLRDHAKKSLPEGFLERTSKLGKIVSWAPQLQVLAHSSVGVFFTHCGWNSILESISNGVPMICRPFFGDQKLNGRMVEDVWKIGVRVKGGVFTKTETINALHHIMSSEAGNAIRSNVRELKSRATDAVKPEGSSSKNFKTLLEIIGPAKDS